MRSQQTIRQLYAGQSGLVRWYVRMRTAIGALEAELLDSLLPRTGLVLDLGCGYGLLANFLAVQAPERQVVGVDLDRARIGVAQSTVNFRANIEFICADARDLAVSAPRAAVMTDFLHHLTRGAQDELLESLAARIEPGGVLLIREANPAHEPRWKYWCSALVEYVMYPDPRSVRLQTRAPSELALRLSRLGLRVHMYYADQQSPFAAILYVCEKRPTADSAGEALHRLATSRLGAARLAM